MEFINPKGIIGGFHIRNAGDGPPGLLHLGEQWAPSGYAIGWHSHECWECFLQVGGTSRWVCAGKSLKIEAGGLLAIPPGLKHRLAEASASHHFMFAGVARTEVENGFHAAGCAVPRAAACFKDDGNFAGAFRRLIRESTMAMPCSAAGMRLAMDLFLLEWARLVVGGGSSMHAGLRIPPPVQRCREMIIANSREHWTLELLARVAGLTPKYLSEAFKRHLGVGFRRFLVETRIAEARRLLRTTNAPVTEIAIEMGFQSGQSFARAFKALTGFTPSGWRQSPEL